ncbi:hypothetical protein [Geomicrobium sp. JCM 19055]|uniref:hypothetical protein n=1 Tax=Geomicrobium sp. JCM 19055 TaxID=1460649 RepID=UPI00045ED0EE|nr:hypothetical protein [Geomicrobium sp. JCM 19055]GAK00154.1 hypothetical protein JCM19055_3227 [Geomicrobium sp. JCM 19055]
MKNRGMWWILGVSGGVVLLVFVAFISHMIGTNQARATLDARKFTLEEIEIEIAQSSTSLTEVNEELSSIQNSHEEQATLLQQLEHDISDHSEEFEEMTTLISERDDVMLEIETLNNEIDDKEESLTRVIDDIETAEIELEKLTTGIVTKAEEPRVLSAGYFTVGQDLPPGRYKVEPNAGSGNYFVNSGSKSNIILGSGDDSFYTSEYIVFLNDGDEIEQTLSVRYTPVEE